MFIRKIVNFLNRTFYLAERFAKQLDQNLTGYCRIARPFLSKKAFETLSKNMSLICTIRLTRISKCRRNLLQVFRQLVDGDGRRCLALPICPSNEKGENNKSEDDKTHDVKPGHFTIHVRNSILHFRV